MKTSRIIRRRFVLKTGAVRALAMSIGPCGIVLTGFVVAVAAEASDE